MPPLRIIPLGGLGEIGMNLMVVEHGDDAIVLDCGMMFPDAATLGVDVIVPDMTYIFENAARFRAVFLTHGHEDHIGAVPFLVERFPLPVFGMPLTLGFLRDKLEEFSIDGIELRAMMPRGVVEIGPFRVEAVRVTLSRTMKRDGKIWIRIFPDKPVTKKPAETRMGSGKGSPEFWVSVVRPGRIMFEVGGITQELATEALRLAGHKLPVKTKMVTRPDYVE